MIKWQQQRMGMPGDEEFELEFQVPAWLPHRFSGDAFQQADGKWWGLIKLGSTELVRIYDVASKEEAKDLLLSKTKALLQIGIDAI